MSMKPAHLMALAVLAGFWAKASAAPSEEEWKAMMAAHQNALETGICEIHTVKMTKTEVPIKWGMELPPGPGEPTAIQRLQLFPNYREFVLGGCCKIEGVNSEKIWICPVCKEKALEWTRKAK